jgi:hypothetical protein
MSVIIKSGSSADLAGVDANNNLKVNTPTDIDQAGYSAAIGEVHDGSSGLARFSRALDVSDDYRLRVGVDSLMWQDNFTHTTFNTSTYAGTTSTMTVALSGGYMVMNSGNSVASGAVARVQTYKTFPMFGTYPLYVEFWARFSTAPQTNNVAELGLGLASGTTTPTDGVYFKLNSSGVLQGIVNYNGVETAATGTLPTITVNQVYHFLIVMNNDRVEFWVDDVLYAAADRPTTAPALSQCYALPILTRIFNSAAVGSAQRLEINAVNISNGDINNTRDWGSAMVGNGFHCISAPPGAAAGQTANSVNITGPTNATLSNTAAGYTTLGGQFAFLAVGGAETDYALFGYTVPAGTAAIAGRSLYITDISISTINTVVAVATTATVMQWGVAVGSTNVNMTTTDSATAAARAPRRQLLGIQTFPVGAAVGAAAENLNFTFTTPLVSEPGTIVHIFLKMPIATATATEVFRGTVRVNGYFE